MVQILPPKTNVGSEIGRALGMGLQSGMESGLSSALQQHLTKQKEDISSVADERNYGTIKDAFGQKFADIWRASPVGARTALTQAGLDAQLRGLKIDDLLSGISPQQPQGGPEKPGSEFPEYKLPTEGMKPSEIPGYQKELRKENVPRLQEAITKERSLKKDLDSIHILSSINDTGKLPTGFGSLLGSLVNPKTGSLIIPSKASPQVQRFVKTVNDFTTRAKDSYGGRVTNFELDRFMQRLPTLANSEEGRRDILRQMEITNELDRIHEDALRKVYQHYGAGNITFEDAEALANNMIRDKEESLRSEYDKIDDKIEAITSEGPDIVEPGTPITTDIAMKYLRQANGDRKKAEQMAREDGYEF